MDLENVSGKVLIRPDKQLEVEPEEKFVPKNATAAVVHLQDWASPKKKLVSTV